MSSSSPPAPHVPSTDPAGLRVPWKRSACDRCRSQKLRCLRGGDKSTNNACLRCMRSNKPCFTSSPRPLGRSHLKNASVPCDNTDAEGDTSVQLANLSMSLLNNMSYPGMANSSFCLPPQYSFLDDNGVDILDFSIDSNNATVLGSAGLLNGDTRHYSNNPFPSIFSPPLTQSPVVLRFPQEQTDEGHRDFTMSSPAPDQNSDPGILFSDLHQRLSRQLFLLQSVPWDIAKVLSVTCSCSSCDDYMQFSEEPPDFNPLASILRLTADFLGLLNMFRTSEGSDDPQSTSGGSPISPQALGTAHLLTILSCYLQTVSVYDLIFSHVHENLSRNPKTMDDVMESAPRMFLGGFPIPYCGSMLVQLLIQLIEDKFRLIESAMGLPKYYCVSLKRPGDGDHADVGLFSGQRGRALLTAFVGPGLEESDNMGDLGAIESLKYKMRSMQQAT